MADHDDLTPDSAPPWEDEPAERDENTVDIFGAPPVGYDLHIKPQPPFEAQAHYVQRFHVLSKAAGFESAPNEAFETE